MQKSTRASTATVEPVDDVHGLEPSAFPVHEGRAEGRPRDDSDDRGSSGTFLVAEKNERSLGGEDAVAQEDAQLQGLQTRALQRFKDETTALIMRDLKSPLLAMILNLEFALEELPVQANTARARSALAETQAAGAKMCRTIGNLLDVARSDDGRLVAKRAPLDIDVLFRRVLRDHAAEAASRGVALIRTVAVDRPIDGDADMLGRVLSTLVDDALRHTNAGGSIALSAVVRSVGRVRTAELTIQQRNRGEIVEAGREDPCDGRDETLGDREASVGLHFCRVAVHAHGGALVRTSGPTATCSFRVELPQP